VITFCEAISREEGWYVPTSRCRRNLNPGNIRYGYFALRHGATGTDGSFAIFPTAAAGFAAMSELLEGFYLGDTITQAITKWAPPTENNTPQYITNVCEWTGLAPDTILTSALLAPPS
jgi:hypothetical protein